MPGAEGDNPTAHVQSEIQRWFLIGEIQQVTTDPGVPYIKNTLD